MNAYVWATGIPGLVDVMTEQGEFFPDLTRGQLWTLVHRHGWQLVPGN